MVDGNEKEKCQGIHSKEGQHSAMIEAKMI